MPHPIRKRLCISAVARLLGCNQATASRRAASGDYGPVFKISKHLKLVSIIAIEARFGAFTREAIDDAILGKKAGLCGSQVPSDNPDVVKRGRMPGPPVWHKITRMTKRPDGGYDAHILNVGEEDAFVRSRVEYLDMYR